jgi:hypothetical protein
MDNLADKYIKRRTAKAAATNRGTSHMAAVIHESAAAAQDFQYGVSSRWHRMPGLSLEWPGRFTIGGC